MNSRMNLFKFIRYSRTARLPATSVQYLKGITGSISEQCEKLCLGKLPSPRMCTVSMYNTWTLHPRIYQCQIGDVSITNKNYSQLVTRVTTKRTAEPFLSSYVSSFDPLHVKYQSSSSSSQEQNCSPVATTAGENVEHNEEIEWMHPATRTEDAFSEDPELRSLLCEITSDFGRSDNHAATESEGTVTKSSEFFTRDEISSKDDDDTVKEGCVGMTADDEKLHLKKDSKDAGNLSPVKASRNTGTSIIGHFPKFITNS